MAKYRVAVIGTVGKSVLIDDTLSSRVAALETQIASVGGVTAHSALTGLQQGNDHPQYPLSRGREQIAGQWNFSRPIWVSDGTAALPAVSRESDQDSGPYWVGADNLGLSMGGALRWDINTSRTLQTVSLYTNLQNAALFKSAEYTIGNVGVEIMNFPGSDPNTDGIGNQLSFWEAGTQAAFNNRSYGFRIRHTGEVNNEGNLDWYRHNNDTTGVLFLRMTRDSSQVQFNVGAATAPSITFIGDTDNGFAAPVANNIAVITGGAERWTFGQVAHVSTLPIRGPDGTAGAPTFTFANNTDNGLALETTDQVAMSAGGGFRMRWATTFVRSSVQHQFINGSAGTPSMGFTSDTDTGRYWVSADLMAETVGGTQRATWSTTALRLVQDNYELQLGASQDLRFYHDGANSIIRNDTGYLQVQGSLLRVVPDSSAIPSSAINADSVLAVGRDSASVSIGLVAPNGGSNGFRFVCAAGGIGSLAAINTASNSYLGYVGASGYDGTTWQTGAAGLLGIRPGSTWSGTNRETFLTFETTASGSTARTERMRLTSAGNLQLRADNEELQLGASQDLRLYHDGTNSIIRNDTGDLKFQSGAAEIVSFNAAPTTGAHTATFAATNKPGTGTAGPSLWWPVKLAGTTYYIPLFGA